MIWSTSGVNQIKDTLCRFDTLIKIRISYKKLTVQSKTRTIFYELYSVTTTTNNKLQQIKTTELSGTKIFIILHHNEKKNAKKRQRPRLTIVASSIFPVCNKDETKWLLLISTCLKENTANRKCSSDFIP